MITVTCLYADGDTITTRFNGTEAEARAYFVGQTFNIGSVDDNMQKCVSITIIEPPAGTHVIKVDGEEIDHADSPAAAQRARNTIIYGEIGTEANTTIERRKDADKDDANETARRIIRTWDRGLITLAEMVTELQKIADAEHRKALQAGAELAARRRGRAHD